MAAVMKNTVTIVRKATIGFSEVESKVIGATTNAPRDGIPCVDITTRAEIASMSLDGDAFDEISHILLQRLKDRSKWRRVLKALIVLHYCLQEGSPKFEAFCRFNLDLLKQLETFEYTWHENCDCGLFIRREAREIITLLNDPSNLGNIHRHSASVRKKKSLSKSGSRRVVVPREKARSQRSPTFTLDMLRAAFKRNNLNRSNSRKSSSDTVSIAESELNCAPVTMRQKVRHALLEDEVFGEMMISEIKDIASGMNKVHDFKDILEALVECTNVAHKDWDCVLKALLLLQSCFCNVYGEVESHFSDRPDLLKELFEHGPWANGMSLAPGVSVEVEAIPTENTEEGQAASDDPILDPFPFTVGRPEDRNSGDLKRADMAGQIPEEPAQDSPPTYNSVSQVTTEPAAAISAELLSSADNEAVLNNLDRKILSEGSSEFNVPPPESTRFSRWSSRFLPQGQIDWTRLTRFNIRQTESTADTVSELQSVVKPESSLGVRDSRPLPPIPVSEVAGDNQTVEDPPPYASGDAPSSPVNAPPMYESLSTRETTVNYDQATLNEELEYEDVSEPPSPTTPIAESPLSMPEGLPEPDACETASEGSPPTSRSASEDTPLEIPLEMIRRDSHPVAGGGFGDVYTGELASPSGSVERVAVKVPRAVRLDLQNPRNVARLANRVLREMRIWGRLHHQNIVPLRGYCIEASGTPNLISPWFEHGNVTSYIASNTDGVSRFDVMKQMARGLLYLHSQDPPVAHGDLKAANVLVDREGNIALTDFGLSKILEETSSSSLSLSTEGFVGSIRWCAPERLLSETSERTLEGDIWSFGCLCLEIFSGRIPYATITNDGCVISHIIMGKLPSRADYPAIMDDEALWSFLHACWKENPAERPTTRELLNMIERMETQSQGRFTHVSE